MDRGDSGWSARLRGSARRLAWTAVLVFGCETGPGPGECYAVCGPQTVCVAGKCVVASNDAEEEEAAPQRRKPKRKRKHKRKRGRDARGPRVDDSDVAEFDPDADSTVDMQGGTKRRDEFDIKGVLGRLDDQFSRCVADAPGGASLTGSVDFTLKIEASGKVAGVNAKASSKLRRAGVLPCMRKTVSRARFPAIDGPVAIVDYSFRIE